MHTLHPASQNVNILQHHCTMAKTGSYISAMVLTERYTCLNRAIFLGILS